MVTHNVYGSSCINCMTHINPHEITYYDKPRSKVQMIRNKFINPYVRSHDDEIFIEDVSPLTDTVTSAKHVKVNNNNQNNIRIASNCKSLNIRSCYNVTFDAPQNITELMSRANEELLQLLPGLKTVYIHGGQYAKIHHDNIEELIVNFNFCDIDAPNLRKLTILNVFALHVSKYILRRAHPDCVINYMSDA